MKIKNASQSPKRYFGLHMSEGVAEYPEMMKSGDSGAPRILILENTLKQMDKSFEGMPVFVIHKDFDPDNPEDLKDLESGADGYVVRSFYNSHDGKHWAEFLVVSDKGHEAISKGWKLSNAYSVIDSRGGGQWHAVPYSQEVISGRYKHLAIVPNPRYEESKVLTPEQFKEYNDRKERELKNLSNSAEPVKKRKNTMKFNFFKRSEVENSVDLGEYGVKLSNGREVMVSELINAEEMRMKEEKENEGKSSYASESDMVKMENGEDMCVKDLRQAYMDLMKEEEEKKNEMSEEEKKKKEEEMKNQELSEEEKKKLEEEKKKSEEKKNSHYNALKNAENAVKDSPVRIETNQSRLARGRSRYGS